MATATKKKPAVKAKAKTTPKAKAPAKAKLPVMKNETASEIIQRGFSLIEEFHKYNIPASVYSAPPKDSGKNVFILSQTAGIPGSLLIWPGNNTVDIKVHGDAAHRQAVVNVSEPRRIIRVTTRSGGVPGQLYNTKGEIYSQAELIKRVTAFLKKNWRSQIMTNVPEGSRFHGVEVKLVGYTDAANAKTDRRHWQRVNYSATIQVAAPATNLSFLTGIDETSTFVALLPKKVESVADAHKALRPTGISKDAVRQGEWFFTPATTAEKEGLLNDSKPVAWEWNGQRRGTPLERYSSHRAERLREVNGVLFAKGTIRDTRGGHHKELQLDEWHRVVRNREQVMPSTSVISARPRRWD